MNPKTFFENVTPILGIAIILLSSVVFNSCSQQVASVESKKTVLFVCKHGAARSPIAAAYFNDLAEKQGLNYTAIFRGTTPASTLSTGTVNGLSKDGFELNGWTPEAVTQKDISAADKIITFDCSVASDEHNTAKTLQWNGTPSISKDYEVARDKIVEHVNALIKSLQ